MNSAAPLRLMDAKAFPTSIKTASVVQTSGHDLLEEGLGLYVEMVTVIQQCLDEEGIEKDAFLAGRHDCF